MKLLIPNKINAGFQNRSDTYTGKLAYIIYWDSKGVLRKEKSWESWRNKDIEPQTFYNEPIEGFVLNKKVGGYKSDWNFRQAYVRIFDPRGFEFEITVPNLLFILAECDCSKGKGLEGKFVYAWDKTDLVLLPISSSTYKDSVSFTDIQKTTVKSKDLVLGAAYVTKDTTKLTYMGRFDWHQIPKTYGSKNDKISVIPKQYVFHDGKDFVKFDSLKSISAIVNSECADNYAELVAEFNRSQNGSKVVELVLEDEPEPKDTSWYYNNRYADKDGNYFVEYGHDPHCSTRYSYGNRGSSPYSPLSSYTLSSDGLIIDKYGTGKSSLSVEGRKAVYAVLESGSKFKLFGGRFCGQEEQ